MRKARQRDKSGYRGFKNARRKTDQFLMRMLLAGLILIQVSAHADLDEHQQNGLRDTKQMLVDPKARNEAIRNDKKAQDVDQKVEALTGAGKNKEEVYGIASEVLEKIATEAKGDPEKMQKILLEAQKDPETFYKKYFNGQQQQRVKGLASEIEKKKAPAPSPK
jgi:hypothetical protein